MYIFYYNQRTKEEMYGAKIILFCLPSVISLKFLSSCSVGHSAAKSFGPSQMYNAPTTGTKKYHSMHTASFVKCILFYKFNDPTKIKMTK